MAEFSQLWHLAFDLLDENDYDDLRAKDMLVLDNIRAKIEASNTFEIRVKDTDKKIRVSHALSPRQIEIIKVGGLINWVKKSAAN